MTMKGVINEDHIPVNKYEMRIFPFGSLVFTTITGLEEELQVVDLPDNTSATGGNTGPVDIEATHPAHHVIQETLLESWFQEGQDPVSPTYKKAGVLILKSNTGNTQRRYPLVGIICRGRKISDLDMSNEGDMSVTTWRFRVDDILPPV